MAKKEIILSEDPDIIKRLPDELRESPEMVEITDAENPRFRVIASLFHRWLDNLFPTTAHEDGIKKFEDMLDLIPQPGDSLQDRRDRVIAKLNETLPYTWISLHRMMANILGWDNFKLGRDGAMLIFELFVKKPTQNLIDIILDLFSRVVPMNIFWEFTHKPKTENQDIRVGAGALISSYSEIPYANDGQFRNWDFIYTSVGTQIKQRVITR